jgi:hypothetical protein
VHGSEKAFAALQSGTGRIATWGDGIATAAAPLESHTGYKSLHSTATAFAAIHATTGKVLTWGDARHGGRDGPATGGWTAIVSLERAFVAYNGDTGELYSWAIDGRCVGCPIALRRPFYILKDCVRKLC